MNVLILASGNPSPSLIKALEAAGHTWEHYRPNELYLYVSESENGYDRIYSASPDLTEPRRLKIKDFDAVISRIGKGLQFGASILQHLTENLNLYCPQSADGLLMAQNKMKTTQRLSSKGLRVPRTVFANKPIHAEFLINKIGGLPAIAKLLSGSQGTGVMILNDATQTNTTLESFYKEDIELLLQSYIDAGAKDIRAIVVGDEVVVAMERSGKKDFRANISQGGSGRKVDLSESDKLMCIQAAKACDLEFAGVDIMKDTNGTSYVIEVNGNPGEKIIEITGVNFFENLVAHISKKKGVTKKKDTANAESVPAKAPTAQVTGKMEGEEEFMEAYGWGYFEPILAKFGVSLPANR